MRDDFVAYCAEEKAIKINASCFSWHSWLRVLTGAHGKKVGADHEVGYHGSGGVEEGRVMRGSEDISEQSWRDDGLLRFVGRSIFSKALKRALKTGRSWFWLPQM